MLTSMLSMYDADAKCPIIPRLLSSSIESRVSTEGIISLVIIELDANELIQKHVIDQNARNIDAFLRKLFEEVAIF